MLLSGMSQMSSFGESLELNFGSPREISRVRHMILGITCKRAPYAIGR